MDQPMVVCFGKLPSIGDLTSVRPRKLRVAALETTSTAEAAAGGADGSSARSGGGGRSAEDEATAEGAESAAAAANEEDPGKVENGDAQRRPPAEVRSVIAGVLTSAHKVLSESLARDHKQLKKLAKHFLEDEATTGALTEKQAARLYEARKAQVRVLQGKNVSETEPEGCMVLLLLLSYLLVFKYFHLCPPIQQLKGSLYSQSSKPPQILSFDTCRQCRRDSFLT